MTFQIVTQSFQMSLSLCLSNHANLANKNAFQNWPKLTNKLPPWFPSIRLFVCSKNPTLIHIWSIIFPMRKTGSIICRVSTQRKTNLLPNWEGDSLSNKAVECSANWLEALHLFSVKSQNLCRYRLPTMKSFTNKWAFTTTSC